VGPELARSGHHAEVWGEHHTAPIEPRGARWACNVRSGRFSRRRQSVKLPLEVTTLDVVTPLTLSVDDNVDILTTVTAVKLGLEVGYHDAHRWHTRLGRHVGSRWLVSNRRHVGHDRGARVCSRRLLPSMEQRVGGSDDELVDVVAPLLRCRW
jgi:hypothetical protein